jgi:WD40 repeat protein
MGSAVASIEPVDDDPHQAVVGSMTGELVLWDTRFPRAPAVLFVGHVNSRTRGLPLSVEPECGLLAGGGEDGVVRVWDVRRGGVPLRTMVVGHGAPVSIATFRARWGARGRPGVLAAVGEEVRLIECGPAW